MSTASASATVATPSIFTPAAASLARIEASDPGATHTCSATKLSLV